MGSSTSDREALEAWLDAAEHLLRDMADSLATSCRGVQGGAAPRTNGPSRGSHRAEEALLVAHWTGVPLERPPRRPDHRVRRADARPEPLRGP